MATTNKQRSSAPRRGYHLGLKIRDDIAERLFDYIERSEPRPTKTSVIELALLRYLDSCESQKSGGVR